MGIAARFTALAGLCAVGGLSVVGGLGCSEPEQSRYYGSIDRHGRPTTTFYLNNYDEPEYLDPGLSTDSASATLINDLFEGLVIKHPQDLRPTQGVATHYDKSADNIVYRFYLRKEARWSDGKPVTAHDFEYAWRRVLRPETAARYVTLMYVLKNAKAFHQGRLKALTTDETLRAEPSAETAATGQLPAGQAVRVLKTSPVQVALQPLAQIPTARELSYRPPGKGKAAAMTTPTPSKGAQPIITTRSKGKPGHTGEAVVMERGVAVKCNEADDYYYRVRVGNYEGWLPGCALKEDRKQAKWALIERFDDLPTYQPAPPKLPAPTETPAPAGSASPATPLPTPAGSTTPEPAGSATPEPTGSAQPPDAPPPASADEPPAPQDPPPNKPVIIPHGFVPYASLRPDISFVGVRARGDHILEVELESPTPYFLEFCATPTLKPVRRDLIEHFDKIGRPDLWYRPENIINNGAYTLDEWKFRYEITFKRNPHHYDHDKLKIHRIVWLSVPDYHATMHLYQTGEIDYIGSQVSLPAAYMDKLTAYEDFSRARYLSTYWYELNTSKPPVDNVHVRHALNLAIDKQLLIDRITRGDQLPAAHYVPDYTGSGYAEQAARDKKAGTDPFSGPEREFNPERARQHLRQAGYQPEQRKDGWFTKDFPALEILYNTSEGHRKIAVSIQDMWRRHLGISVQLRNEEWKVMLKNLRDGHFHVGRFGWIADYNHPHTWMDLFLSYSSNNRTHWSDPRFDALIKQASATADPVKSIQLYRQAEALAVDAMPRIPLYFYTKSTLIKPYVRGFYLNNTNIHEVRWMWIDDGWHDSENKPSYPPRELPPPKLIEPQPAGATPIEPEPDKGSAP